MAPTRKVVVAIQGKDEYSAVVDKAGKKTKGALRLVEKQQDRTKQSSKELTTQQRKLGNAMSAGKTQMLSFAAGAVSIVAVVAVFRKLGAAINDAIAASSKQQIAFTKLDNALRNLGINTEEKRQHFRELASSMQDTRGIADNLAATLFAQLLFFTNRVFTNHLSIFQTCKKTIDLLNQFLSGLYLNLSACLINQAYLL